MKFRSLVCVKCKQKFTSAVSDQNDKPAKHCNSCRYHRGWNEGKFRKVPGSWSSKEAGAGKKEGS